MAMYAFARERRVGIDIEHVCVEFATLEVAERFFLKEEFESLKAASIGRRTEAFFNCWSRKEAYIKAIGMGGVSVGRVHCVSWRSTCVAESRRGCGRSDKRKLENGKCIG